MIGRLALDLVASDAASDPSPVSTTLYIDSVWIDRNTTLVGPYDFTTASTVNNSSVADDWAQALNTLYLRPSITAWGSVSALPAGSAISWQMEL